MLIGVALWRANCRESKTLLHFRLLGLELVTHGQSYQYLSHLRVREREFDCTEKINNASQLVCLGAAAPRQYSLVARDRGRFKFPNSQTITIYLISALLIVLLYVSDLSVVLHFVSAQRAVLPFVSSQLVVLLFISSRRVMLFFASAPPVVLLFVKGF